MKTRIIIAIALWILAGAANGVMDTLFTHYSSSIFVHANAQYWDPYTSWENKYALDAEGKLVQPLRPRFWGSTHVLVFLTDGWHLMKQLMLWCISGALVALWGGVGRWEWRGFLFWAAHIGLAVVLSYVFGAGFSITYDWLLR